MLINISKAYNINKKNIYISGIIVSSLVPNEIRVDITKITIKESIIIKESHIILKILSG